MIPPHRLEPGPGRESVWEYPRPPRLESSPERLRVIFVGEVVADTTAGCRVLETSHPPVYYFPLADVVQRYVEAVVGSSRFEFKGNAQYWSVVVAGKRSFKAAWSYPSPAPGFERLTGHLAFYASRVDACWVGNERVQPQEGDFYGGWITSRIVGPFKGAPGTKGW